MEQGKIIILSGPSGSGKTTLYKKLLNEKDLKGKLFRSVSFTTRKKREGEKQGRDYFFVSRKVFLRKKEKGDFLESKKVFDNFYGTSKRIVNNLLAEGKSVLLTIDVKGAKEVMRKFPKAKRIFIKTPSLNELRKRLLRRGTDNEHTISLRVKNAKKELLEAEKYDYILVNDILTKCYKELFLIVEKELRNLPRSDKPKKQLSSRKK